MTTTKFASYVLRAAIFVVALAPTAADAACAWVLWYHETPNADSRRATWSVNGATETLVECNQKRAEMLATAATLPGVGVQGQLIVSLPRGADTNKTLSAYECLPAGTDPRREARQ